MIKAVATALVLIVGAAVVLWYGNTLNSWVVGGLVGGFGALLLSIPISLVLFSYLSHHYNKHQQEEVLADEIASFVQQSSYSIAQDRLVYNDDEEYFDEDQDFYYEYDDEELYENELAVDDEYLLAEHSVREEELLHRMPLARRLPSPSSARFSAASQDPPSQLQRDHYGADPERQPVRRRKSGSRPVKDSSSRSYRTDPSYSRYRSEALHAARMEAVSRAEYDEEGGFSSPRATRRLEQMQRSGQMLPPQNKGGRPPSLHDLTQSSTNNYSQRPQRIVDALPLQDRSRRPLSSSDDASQTDRFTRYRDPQTEHSMDEATPDNLRRPLIRRAPYMYDDDLLREEMAQYVERPAVRRSSRYLRPPSIDNI
ncbi:MAG TPA: hypothetical protein VGL94_02470 [Ktedonobacteraceae bacterium]